MRPPHLHFRARNAPLAIRQIKLGPFGLPKLTGSDKDQWGQLESIPGDRLPFEAIDGAEQGAHGVGLDDRCAVGNGWSDQRAAKIARRIPFGSSRGDGKTKHGSRGTAQAGRSLMVPALLDLSQRVEDFRGFEFGNRTLAQLLVGKIQ